MSRYCQSCGSAVADDATVCGTCGEPLDGTTPADAVNEADAVQAEPAVYPAAAHPAETAPAEPPPSRAKRTSPAVDYLLGFIAAAAVAGIVFIWAAPEEVKGPPQDQATANGGAGAMPPGHPPAGGAQGPVVTPEMQAQIAALEKHLNEKPDDAEAKLKLANLYYDVERHAEAVPLYYQYLRTKPNDMNARTDMAYSIASNGNLDSAIRVLLRVTQEDTRHQNAAYNLAMMYIAKRNRDSTLLWLNRVRQIDSTSRQGQLASQILGEVNNAPAGGAAPGGAHPEGDHTHETDTSGGGAK